MRGPSHMEVHEADATPVELAAMNAWASAAVAHLESTVPSLLETLRGRMHALGSFSRRVFPQIVHTLPGPAQCPARAASPRSPRCAAHSTHVRKHACVVV